MYTGGLEEFTAYTNHFYNRVPVTTEEIDVKIAAENLDAYSTLRLEQAQSRPTDPLRICITNASSRLAYLLAPLLITTKVFGDQKIHLHLLDTKGGEREALHGLAMELQDLAHPNLKEVTCTDSAQEAFKAVSAVYILDEFGVKGETVGTEEGSDENEKCDGKTIIDRGQIFGESKEDPSIPLVNELEKDTAKVEALTSEEESKTRQEQVPAEGKDDGVTVSSPSEEVTEPPELLAANADELHLAATTFDQYAGLLDYLAQKDVKVIIVGPYSNTGAALMSRRVSSIDKKNFIASSCLAESQASSILAGKLGVATADVHQVGIWGRSQGDVIPDTSSTIVYHFQGAIVGPDNFSLGIKKCLFDHNWLKDDFLAAVMNRHNNIDCYGNRGVSLAEAVSLSKLMKSWWHGNGSWHSVGVVHEEDGIALSCPCSCLGGSWEKIQDTTTEDRNTEKLEAMTEQLKSELEKTLSFIGLHSENESVSETPNSKL